jgi:hypothetical protein
MIAHPPPLVMDCNRSLGLCNSFLIICPAFSRALEAQCVPFSATWETISLA